MVAWQYQSLECTVLLVLAGCCPLGPVSVLCLSCYYSCLSDPPPPLHPPKPLYLYHSCSRHFTILQLVWGSNTQSESRFGSEHTDVADTNHWAVIHCLYGKNGWLCHVSMRDRRQLFISHLIKRCMLACWCLLVAWATWQWHFYPERIEWQIGESRLELRTIDSPVNPCLILCSNWSYNIFRYRRSMITRRRKKNPTSSSSHYYTVSAALSHTFWC